MDEVKVPPHNLEAERCVLGAMMLDKRATQIALATITAEDFYSSKHGLIFEAVVSFPLGTHVDSVLLTEKLMSCGKLDEAGGISYLVQVMHSTPSAANIEHYIGIVKEHSNRRTHLSSLMMATEAIFADTSLTEIDNSLLEMITSRATETKVNTYDQQAGLAEDHHAIESENNRVVPTGIQYVDDVIPRGGFKCGTLNFIAARPRIGKSALSQYMAQNIAAAGVPVLYIQQEMTRSEMYFRWRSQILEIPYEELERRAKFYFPRIKEADEQIGKCPLYIDDSPSLNVAQVTARAYRAKALGKCGILFIDHLTRMNNLQRKDENLSSAIGRTCRGLKTLAKELEIPVVVLAQLNRGGEKAIRGQGKIRRPILSDLRNSGEIEEEADLVLGLYREWMNTRDDEVKNIMEVIVLKARGGREGVIPIGAKMPINQFYDLTSEESEVYLDRWVYKKKKVTI